MTPQQADRILMFMGRADLKGNEAPTFMACVELIRQLAAPDEPEAETPEAETPEAATPEGGSGVP